MIEQCRHRFTQGPFGLAQFARFEPAKAADVAESVAQRDGLAMSRRGDHQRERTVPKGSLDELRNPSTAQRHAACIGRETERR